MPPIAPAPVISATLLSSSIWVHLLLGISSLNKPNASWTVRSIMTSKPMDCQIQNGVIVRRIRTALVARRAGLAQLRLCWGLHPVRRVEAAPANFSYARKSGERRESDDVVPQPDRFVVAGEAADDWTE